MTLWHPPAVLIILTFSSFAHICITITQTSFVSPLTIFRRQSPDRKHTRGQSTIPTSPSATRWLPVSAFIRHIKQSDIAARHYSVFFGRT
ncbi:hypothetical protein BGZ63DRAFT_57375 [Mariannaea sp. PMI_226]|nr:hypothetical protein BGZ63DRAFT_57375 [Mariannaea sp. PMI_226]